MNGEEREALRAEISRVLRIADLDRDIETREWKIDQGLPTDRDRLRILRIERADLYAVGPLPGKCAAFVGTERWKGRIRCSFNASIRGYCRRHARVYGVLEDRPERHANRWTVSGILQAIRKFADENGRPPTSHEWKRSGDHPSFNTVTRLLGTWADAIEAAGFDRPSRGRSPLTIR